MPKVVWSLVLKMLSAPMPEGFRPWFEFDSLAAQTHQIVFGHWAALQGRRVNSQIQNVDGGVCGVIS
jgi:bis(5'-nucleosyl)-tetraphosphatase (symmetrical)